MVYRGSILPEICKPCFLFPLFNLRNLLYLILSALKNSAVVVLRENTATGDSGCFYRRIWPFERFGGNMEQENRLKITVWLKPDVVQRMDGWLKADNCRSRGEFTEKALRFYMGYLATEDTSVFLLKSNGRVSAGQRNVYWVYYSQLRRFA